MITLTSDRATAVIDPAAGGRLTQLVIDGYEILRDPRFNTDSPVFGYGSFPMAPYAGRIRHGSFRFQSRQYQLKNLADSPHALHGTVIYDSWLVTNHSTDKCEIQTNISGDWPFRGTVKQMFELTNSELRMVMELQAIDAMPAWLGFHPWFRKVIDGNEYQLTANFDHMYLRDAEKIATKLTGPPKPLPWDDCFVGTDPKIEISWGDLLSLKLVSNYPYWVIYSAPKDAICIEPQTAPPNAIEIEKAAELTAGESLRLDFSILFNS